MSEKKTISSENDFDPVNRFIDEQSSIRRSRSFWGYSKSIAVILIAVGILAILIAYAYKLYQEKQYFLSKQEIKIQLTKEFETKNNQVISSLNNKISGLQRANQNLKNSSKQKDNIVKEKNDEIKILREKVVNNPKLREYERKLEELKKKNSNLQTNLIYFIPDRNDPKYQVNIKGILINIKTRWHFKDPRQQKPNKVDCYATFPEFLDISALELGEKNKDFEYNKFFLNKLKITKSEIEDIKKKYCEYL